MTSDETLPGCASDDTLASLDETLGPMAAAPTIAAPIAAADHSKDPSLPARIGRFAVLRSLGQGGMGVVYSAYDEQLDRRVAIKVLRRASGAATERMRREAQAMAKVSHPNVAAVFEVGNVAGQIYMAIEFIKGQTLREWLDASPRATAEIVSVMIQAGRGLEAAHQAGLVHRDFKPDNVMVGDDGRVRVLDFGLAGLGDATPNTSEALELAAANLAKVSPFATPLTETGALMGTPGYMSPEQFAASATGPASDQFSFCVSLAEALYNERPFEGDSFHSLAFNVSAGKVRAPPPGTKVPASLRAIVLRGLAVAAGDRYPDMAALLRALEAIAGLPKRRRMVGVGVVTAFAALVLGLGWWQQSDEMIARLEASDLRVDEHAAVARQAESEAERAAIAQHNALLIAVAHGFADSPTEAAAVLREVTGANPSTSFGWEALADPLRVADFNLVARLDGHAARLTDAVFSPDGQRIVTASTDNSAQVWNADGSGEPLILRGHTDTVSSVAFSPDGQRVVTGSHDGTARVWSMTGATTPVVLEGHAGPISSASFSPDGERVVTSSEDASARLWTADGSGTPKILAHDDAVGFAGFSPDGARLLTATGFGFSEVGLVRVWSADGSGEPLALRGHEGFLFSARFSPDSQRIVTAATDNSARVWNCNGPGSPVVLTGHQDWVVAAVFSPDGRRIATASLDKTARIWRADGSGEARVLDGHAEALMSVAFSPDGTRVLTTSMDTSARIWNVDGAGEAVVLAGHTDAIRRASFSPDGTRVVTASEDKSARVWATTRSRAPVVLPQDGDYAVFSPDGRFVGVPHKNNSVRIWRADGAGEPVVFEGHEAVVRDLDWTPDGRRVVTTSDDHTARVWRLDGSTMPVVLRGHTDSVLNADISPDGARIVTASGDKTARIWALDGANNPPVVLSGHEAEVDAAEWSPDGTRIVTSSKDDTARVWAADGTNSVVLRGHTARVWSPSFSPDGARILTASDDQTARVWQADGQGDPVVLRGHTGVVTSARFSPDGARVLTTSSDNTVRIWSADGSSEPTVLEAADESVSGAEFSPDGARILVASDKGARLWNADGSGPPTLLRGHVWWVRSAVWSPDGARVLTASADGTVRVWTLDAMTLDHLRTALWRASRFCHASEIRSQLFGEPIAIAEANHHRCVELTEYCADNSPADCHARVRESFLSTRTDP